MQKNIIALAIVAAFAAPVSAMAAVTVYGTMDGGLRHQTNEGAAGTTDSLAMGQYNTARWGFKSVEDMGDGLKTIVVLETSLFPPSVGIQGGAAVTGGSNANPYGLIFDRQATLGLSSGDNTFNMGWQYSLAWDSVISNDPFAGKFNDITYVKAAAGNNSTMGGAGGVRIPGVTLGTKFGDVAVRGQYVMNNSAPTSQPSIGTGRSVSVSYASGAINVSGAYAANEANTTAAGGFASTLMTVGGGFNFGDGKVSVGYAKKAFTMTGATDGTNTTTWLGASYNMSSAVAVSAAMYKNADVALGATPEATKTRMMAMVTYALSKPTNLYLEADTQTFNAGTTGALDVKTTGVSVGLATVF
jgi:predicted porin